MRPFPYEPHNTVQRRIARNLAHVYGDNEDPENECADGFNYGELTHDHVLAEMSRLDRLYHSTVRHSRPKSKDRRSKKLTVQEIEDVYISYLSGNENEIEVCYRFDISPRMRAYITNREFEYQRYTRSPRWNLLSDGEVQILIDKAKYVLRNREMSKIGS